MFSETAQWVYTSPLVAFFPPQICDLICGCWGVKVWFCFSGWGGTSILWGTCALPSVLILILFNSLCLTHNSRQAPQIGEFPNNPELTQAWNWFSVEHLPPPFGHFTNLTKFVPSLVLSTRSVFCPHLDSFLQFAHSLQNVNSFVRGWATGWSRGSERRKTPVARGGGGYSIKHYCDTLKTFQISYRFIHTSWKCSDYSLWRGILWI